MIYTARQLEELHKGDGQPNGSNGQIVLPYGARLTPLAQDWAKAKKITLGFSDVKAATRGKNGTNGTNGTNEVNTKNGAQGVGISGAAEAGGTAGLPLMWWCDGPCGAAKAAVMAQAKESSLSAVEIGTAANGNKGIVSAVRHLAGKVKKGEAGGGVLMVQTGAMALVFANRCQSLRAVLGTCLEAVEQGVAQVAANVLVIEYPHKSLPQIKTLLSRFVRGRRTLSDEVRKQLEELASCG